VRGESVDRIMEAVSTYGYPVLLVTSVAENVFLLGFFVPGDLVVVLGGAVAAGGHLALPSVLAVVLAGVIAGSVISFWIGRRGGLLLVERWGERIGISPARIEAVEVYFRAHGAKTVFVGSFVAGFKNLVPVVAGASRMNFATFLLFNAAGGLCRSVALLAVGYLFGANAERALRIVSSLNIGVVALLLGLVLAAVLIRRSRRGRAGR
jgi:membrane-associated protein